MNSRLKVESGRGVGSLSAMAGGQYTISAHAQLDRKIGYPAGGRSLFQKLSAQGIRVLEQGVQIQWNILFQ